MSNGVHLRCEHVRCDAGGKNKRYEPGWACASMLKKYPEFAVHNAVPSEVKPLQQLCFDVLKNRCMHELGLEMADVVVAPVPVELLCEWGELSQSERDALSYSEILRREDARWRHNRQRGGKLAVSEARDRVTALLAERVEAYPCPHAQVCSGGPVLEGGGPDPVCAGVQCHRGHRRVVRPCPDTAIKSLCASAAPFVAEHRALLEAPPPPLPDYSLSEEDENAFYESGEALVNHSDDALWQFKQQRRETRKQQRVFAPFAYP